MLLNKSSVVVKIRQAELRKYLLNIISKKTNQELLDMLDVRCGSCKHVYHEDDYWGWCCKLKRESRTHYFRKACEDIEFRIDNNESEVDK